jgi:DNA polymerase I-like protein with 3'-5' exonuclease and polymerase domains
MKPLLALDTETTGADFYHGSRPFFVSTCDQAGTCLYWEFSVDPTNRQVNYHTSDLKRIATLINHSTLVLHNSKFDIRALESAKVKINPLPTLARCQDTLIAAHCLDSLESHKLKDLAVKYLDIHREDQDSLRDACNHARRIGRKLGWDIARPNHPHFPGMSQAPRGEGWWCLDMWLPKAVCLYAPELLPMVEDESYPWKTGDPVEEHPWFTVCRNYALCDAERTIALWLIQREALQEEHLEGVYHLRKKLLPITYQMETHGVSINTQALTESTEGFLLQKDQAEEACFKAVSYRVDNLSSPKQVQAALFSVLKLKPVSKTKTGQPSTKAEDLQLLLAQSREGTKAHTFLANLLSYRKSGKALEALESYGKYGSPHPRHKTHLILHPWLNITGTHTTRFSSQYPNGQNVSKKEDFNLRAVFGPLPGREWFTIDYSNIEKRIPAHLSAEEDLIKLFNEGGSYHLLVAELLYPKLFREHGPEGFKELPQYRRVKNGNFAEQYGAGKRLVDATFGVKGGYAKVKGRFAKLTALATDTLEGAQSNGYVTTLGGYRLQCPFDVYGRIEPTKPFNYLIQGSAGMALIYAMVRISGYLDEINATLRKNTLKGYSLASHGFFMSLQIHDELMFDFPKRKGNLSKIRKIASLMEQSGEDFGFPLPVEITHITTTWDQGVTIK